MELDEAEEAEVVSATLADFVEALRARESGSDADGNPTFATTSPDWWVGDRTFGGMVVAQALSAGMQTAPAGMEVHSLHGYFLRPTRPGAETTHVVSRIRDGRSFLDSTGGQRRGGEGGLPDDLLLPRPGGW